MHYKLITDCGRNRAVVKELDILAGVELNMSQQGMTSYPKEGKPCTQGGMATAFEGSYSLLDADEDTQGLLCPGVTPCFKHSVDQLERILWRATTVIWGTHVPRGEAEESGLIYSTEEEHTRVACSYLKV